MQLGTLCKSEIIRQGSIGLEYALSNRVQAFYVRYVPPLREVLSYARLPASCDPELFQSARFCRCCPHRVHYLVSDCLSILSPHPQLFKRDGAGSDLGMAQLVER